MSSNRWEVMVIHWGTDNAKTYPNKPAAIRAYYNRVSYFSGGSGKRWRREGTEVQLNNLVRGVTERSYTVGEGHAPKTKLLKSQGAQA